MPEISIEAINLGKEYNHQTIFQQVYFKYRQGQAIAVVGDNGSGKSTLLRIMAGMSSATHGSVTWNIDNQIIPPHQFYKYLSFCSPGFHFDYRFTVSEILDQYSRVKGMQDGMDSGDLIDLIDFQPHRDKLIGELSSGMNQRLRLVLTLCTDSQVLFLDEPCSYLDQQGVSWYHEMITRFCTDKLVFVASNDNREYEFCNEKLSLMDYRI